MTNLQCVPGNNALTSTATLVITIAPTTAGSLIYVPFQFNNGGGQTVTSVKDSANNVYTAGFASPPTLVSYQSNGYYFAGVGAGVTSVTITLSSGTVINGFVTEESGLATSSVVDGTPVGATNATSTSFNSGTTTPASASDVLFGFSGSPAGSGLTYTATGGWAALATSSNSSDGDTFFIERQVVAAATPVAATGTISVSSNLTSTVIAFKKASVVQLPYYPFSRTQFFVTDNVVQT